VKSHSTKQAQIAQRGKTKQGQICVALAKRSILPVRLGSSEPNHLATHPLHTLGAGALPIGVGHIAVFKAHVSQSRNKQVSLMKGNALAQQLPQADISSSLSGQNHTNQPGFGIFSTVFQLAIA
jgi:hypothetical protein